MYKKVFIILAVCVFLLGMATRKELENVKEAETPKDTVTGTLTKTQKEDKNGYRIEVVGEKLRGGEDKDEIRFVSPEGNVVKSVQLKSAANKIGDLWHIESTNLEEVSADKSKVIISEFSSKTRYNPEELTDYPGYEGEIWNFSVSLMNSKGDIKFAKQFKTFPGKDPTASYWKTLFSKQGNSVLFFYRDSEHFFNVEVYDEEGNKLAEASNENYLRNLQIAPDGKIVGAETEQKVGKAWIRHLFFLNVETGETKIVKAEGEGWEGWFSLLTRIPTKEGYEDLPSKHVKIRWRANEKRGGAITSFDQLPNDLSTLFGGER